MKSKEELYGELKSLIRECSDETLERFNQYLEDEPDGTVVAFPDRTDTGNNKTRTENDTEQ
jgi:hypothetical protein